MVIQAEKVTKIVFEAKQNHYKFEDNAENDYVS